MRRNKTFIICELTISKMLFSLQTGRARTQNTTSEEMTFLDTFLCISSAVPSRKYVVGPRSKVILKRLLSNSANT